MVEKQQRRKTLYENTYLFSIFGRDIFFLTAHSFSIILLFLNDLINEHTQRAAFNLS